MTPGATRRATRFCASWRRAVAQYQHARYGLSLGRRDVRNPDAGLRAWWRPVKSASACAIRLPRSPFLSIATAKLPSPPALASPALQAPTTAWSGSWRGPMRPAMPPARRGATAWWPTPPSRRALRASLLSYWNISRSFGAWGVAARAAKSQGMTPHLPRLISVQRPSYWVDCILAADLLSWPGVIAGGGISGSWCSAPQRRPHLSANKFESSRIFRSAASPEARGV
jgi:hypothetical protein